MDKVRIKIHEIIKSYLVLKKDEYIFNWADVCDHDKEELAGLIIAKNGGNTDDLIIRLQDDIVSLLIGTISALDVAQSIKQESVDYYNNYMQFIVNIEIPEVYHEMKEGYLDE